MAAQMSYLPRGRMPGFSLASLALVACLCSTAIASSSYVTSTDLQFRDDADNAAALWCEGYTGGKVSEEDGRRALEDGMGGENIILDALTEAEDQDEFMTELNERLSTFGPLYIKGFPIVAAIFLLIIWSVMCCTACPSKKLGCCRCCKRAWECPFYMKSLALGIVVLLFVGLLLSISMAWDGTDAATGGVSGLACTAARLVNSSYAGGGSENNSFMGMLPTLELFETLDGELDDGSVFVTEINNLIDSTEDIDKAVMVASNTMKLLKDALEAAANADPKNNGGSSLLHDGLLSSSNGLPPVLTAAIDALDGGVATALANARSAAKEQLSTEKRQEIQSQLRNAILPLTDAKNSMRSSFQSAVDPSIRDQWEGQVEMGLLGLVMGLFVWAVLAMCCGCGAIGCCFKRQEENNHIHRLACSTWCCSFYLAIVALLIGGLMLITAVPLSSACLILADVDRDMLNGIGDAIQMNMTGDEGIMLGDMVEKCFNPADPSAPASLMDILFQRNETTGQKVTLRDRFIDQFKSEIDGQFNSVTATLNMDLPSLAQDSRIIALREALANNPADQMFLTRPSIATNADFSALDDMPTLKAAALNSSASCSSFHSNLLDYGIGGISDFLTELQAIGSAPFSPISNGLPCTQTVDCGSSSNQAACEAGNRLMYLKAALQSDGALDAATGTAATNTYRCDLFTIPSDSSCDVLNMPATSATDAQMCLQGSAGTYSMSTSPIQCNLADFTMYIAQFSTRLEKVLQNVDTVTADVSAAINVTLRQTLDTHIMDPLDNMASSMQCNFLAPLYADVVDSFCYQGMWGFRRIAVSYTTLGFFQVLLIPLMYTIYRIGRDRLDDPTLDVSKHETV